MPRRSTRPPRWASPALLDLRAVAGGVRFPVRVQPRASRSEVAGLHDRALKLRLTAPPVEGAANAACVDLLAGVLGVPRGQVRIVAGQQGRDKVVEVAGLTVEEAAARLGIRA